MRVFIAISIVVASVSSASAQTMDAAQIQAAMAAAVARAAYATPYRQQSNFYVGGSSTMKITPRTAEDLKADEAGQAAWKERCRPTVVEDREGLRRVRYAERDCDLSRFNTAGN
jgi:hypothetical protein